MIKNYKQTYSVPWLNKVYRTIEVETSQNVINNTSNIHTEVYIENKNNYNITFPVNSVIELYVKVRSSIKPVIILDPNIPANTKVLIGVFDDTIVHTGDYTFLLDSKITVKNKPKQYNYDGILTDDRLIESNTGDVLIETDNSLNFKLDAISKRGALINQDLNFSINEPIALNFRLPEAYDYSLNIIQGGNIVRAIPQFTSETFTLTLTEAEKNSIYNNNINTNTVDFTIKLSSYSKEGVLLENPTIPAKFILDQANPIFTNFDYSDTWNLGLTGNSKILVRQIGRVEVFASGNNLAVGQKGATIVSYDIRLGNDIKSVANNGTIASALFLNNDSFGPTNTSITAIDSRNNKTTVNKVVNIIDYQNPIFNATAKRVNGIEASTNILIKGSISSVTINGVRKNKLATLKYKVRNLDTEHTNINLSNVTYIGENFIVNNIVKTIPIDNTYEIEIVGNDSLGNVVGQLLIVKSANVPYSLNGDGDLKQLGALLQVNGKKFISDNGYTVNRYPVGYNSNNTLENLRVFKMGESISSNGDTVFPTNAGAWAYFQSSPYLNDSNNFGDFLLWKNKLATGDLYVGTVQGTSIDSIGRVVTMISEDIYTGTNYYNIKKYSDGRQVIEFALTMTRTFTQETASKLWSNITNTIVYPNPFIKPPVLTIHPEKAEIIGCGIRSNTNTECTLRIYSLINITGAVQYRFIANGYWK